MGHVKNIYFSEMTYEKLKSVPNVSGLIECLLQDYFKTNGTNIDELKKQKQELLKEKKGKVEVLNKEVKKIEHAIETQEKDAAREAEKEKKREENKAIRIKGVIELFASEGVVMSEVDAVAYLELFDAGLTDFYAYVKEKKATPKEVGV